MKKVFVRTMQCLKKRQIKLINLLALFLLLAPSLYAQITIDVKSQPIRQILRNIEKTSDYKFFYNNDLLDLDKTISFSVTNATIDPPWNRFIILFCCYIV